LDTKFRNNGCKKNMAKKNISILAIIGGIVALVGIGLSIFIEEIGWWNYFDILNNNIVDSSFFSAFFGTGEGQYFSDTFKFLLPGIIAGAGALICLLGNKFLSIIGSIAVIAGIILFIIFLPDADLPLAVGASGTSIYWDNFGVTVLESFTGAKWRFGIGFFITGGGGLLSLVGGLISNRK
jgi:hypothetical protein